MSTIGARVMRVNLVWSAVAPARQSVGFNAKDPGSAGYSWSPVDAAVRAAAAHGLSVVMLIYSAPSWAEGPGRPSSAPAGTWKPSASALGQFAHAAALRYSGTYPDPLQPGHFLPRVSYWEAWNEPNLPNYLNPQWRRASRGFAPESPVIYRGMLNAFYGAVKSVSRANRVIAGATAPYGDLYRGGQARLPPVTFVQTLLCLEGRRLSRGHCGAPAQFDIFDHHPYDVGGPLQRAINANDVSLPDIGKLTRLLRAARRAGTVAPRTSKPVWTTEIGWSSRPPDPAGVPVVRLAHWLEQALYVLWRQGVSHVFWIEPEDPQSNPRTSFDAGLYYSNGQPKPAVSAFRFPFVAVRQHAHGVRVWGRAPAAGTVLIQRLRGRDWVTVKRIPATARQVFFVPVSVRGREVLRARQAGVFSLPWP